MNFGEGTLVVDGGTYDHRFGEDHPLPAGIGELLLSDVSSPFAAQPQKSEGWSSNNDEEIGKPPEATIRVQIPRYQRT